MTELKNDAAPPARVPAVTNAANHRGRVPPFRAFSFDHLVGDGEQRRRDFEAERFGGLEVDGEHEGSRQQHWQLGWLGATENPTGVDASLSITVGDTTSVAHQATSVDELTLWTGRGNSVARRQQHDLITLPEQKRVAADDKSVGPLAPESGEGRIDLGAGAGVQGIDQQSERVARRPARRAPRPRWPDSSD